MRYGMLALTLLITAVVWRVTKASDLPAPSVQPVLVELFTSEGCSSCPPADAVLGQLDRSGSAIVLSEHVDYWNSLGWKDPYSSPLFSERQSAYARHFGLSSVYTPQMVVDGGTEFVGSDSRQAEQAIGKARGQSKVPVRIVSIMVDKSMLWVRVEADALPKSAKRSDLYLALVRSHSESEVTRGENAGRKLSHVGVVRILVKAGFLTTDEGFAGEIKLPLDRDEGMADLRIVAFVQETGAGRVLGVTAQSVPRKLPATAQAAQGN